MLTPAEHLSSASGPLNAAAASRSGDVAGGGSAKRRAASRLVFLDRALEALPFFRLSDSNEEGAISFTAPVGGKWRVLPAPGDRLPGTFDQDVYIELLYRYQDAQRPPDGVMTFTLHAFLRAMGRRVDGRTYEQLRGALARLERTTLESAGGYWDAANNRPLEGAFTLLSAATVDRRRAADRDQLSLFPSVTAAEPGVARVTLAPQVRSNLDAGHVTSLRLGSYSSLLSPVARRIYRLLAVQLAAGADGLWRVSLDTLADLLPLTQRYPSHILRVVKPASEMLVAAGIVDSAEESQDGRSWFMEYRWT
ncbi:MAG: replication initiator protein A [Gemmatimonadaceae bacterium]|nr:replication initiator protein A [Gemmatimonadaceae bacterium]